jgi:hypothetical protein
VGEAEERFAGGGPTKKLSPQSSQRTQRNFIIKTKNIIIKIQEKEPGSVIPTGCGKTPIIRHSGESRGPDFVPTKVGNHLEDRIPVFTGNPGFRLSPE